MKTTNQTPEEEYEQGMAEAMYCTACQAMLWQECICEDEDEDRYPPYTDKEIEHSDNPEDY